MGDMQVRGPGERVDGARRGGQGRGDCHPRGELERRPLARVAFKPGQNAAPEVLNAHLLQHGFARWQLPDRYETIAAVPRTSTAKFWKLKLRQMFPR